MRKGIIFGAGELGKHVYDMVKDSVEIICFVDNDEFKWGGVIDGKEIRNPEILKTLDVDAVFLGNLTGFDEIPKQLDLYGVPPTKLDTTQITVFVKARILFLEKFADLVYKEGIEGSVGEAGVLRGEFAKHINRVFYDRKCYLFDTFDGFTEEDINKEPSKSAVVANQFKNVNVESVLAKMPNRENIVVKIGRFPETAEGIADRFAFVNLDMDLYQPTLEGLRFFYPLMSNGGVILIHDYFTWAYPNVKKAVADFETEMGIKLHKMPIGDNISMAIVK